MSADLGTAPSMGDNHPSELAWTAINNAAQVAQELRTPGEDGGSIEDDGDRIVELLTDAGMHVADLVALLKHQERTIEEQKVTIVRANQSWLRVTDANSALNVALNTANTRIAVASREIEQLLITASIDTQRSAVFFSEVRKVREALDPTIAHDAPTRTTAPRIAAGAR